MSRDEFHLFSTYSYLCSNKHVKSKLSISWVFLMNLLTTEYSIVFAHGSRSHRRNSWTKDDVCWPEELLSKEETRVLTFGDDVQVISRTSTNGLFKHPINLQKSQFTR
jgi:hypothetical protein